MLNKGSVFSSHRATTSPTPASIIGSDQTKVAAEQKAVTALEKPSPERTTAQSAAESEGTVARLVVGPGVKLKGAEILDCDTLLVEGRVEATMDSRFIQIADQGSFDGKVNIDVAEIRGCFSGELTARQQLIIHSTGRVSGKIRYGKIVVHEGGELSGDIKSASAPEVKAEEASANIAFSRPLAKTA
jgi:cytoskeletal protein CcmA (bactofilin family)